MNNNQPIPPGFQSFNVINLNIYNNNPQTPLSWAAQKGNLEIVKILIENGARINLSINNYNTALYFAAQNGH